MIAAPPPMPRVQAQYTPPRPSNVYMTPGQAYSSPGAGITPGPAAPSQREMVNVVESVAKGFQGALESVVEKFAELHAKDSEGPNAPTDKFQAISGLEFKRAPPAIRDDDPDLDRHDQAFDNMVACYSFGSKKPRDIDRLQMYASGCKEKCSRMHFR